MKRIHTISTAAVLALLMAPVLAQAQQAANDGEDPVITDGSGGSSAGLTEDGAGGDSPDTTSSDGDTSGGADTASNEGAYDALSPGGQKIAKALADQQPEPVDGGDADTAEDTGTSATADGAGTATTEPLSLDDIAAARQDGQGWGQVFKDMQADGLTTEKNLGQVVAKSNRRQVAATDPGTTETDVSGSTATEPTTAASTSSAVSSQSRARRPVVISLGNGGTMTIGGGNGKAYGRTSTQVNSATTPGNKPNNAGVTASGNRGGGKAAFVTGNGGSGNNHANGNAYGHSNAGSTAGNSANAGIVSAAGGNAGAQASQAGVTAAGGNGNAGGNGHGKAKGHNK